MGDIDFVAISRVQNRPQMHDVIENMVCIEGVDKTSSRFAMDEIQTNPRVAPVLSEASRSAPPERRNNG